jgi:hypothetical protein
MRKKKVKKSNSSSPTKYNLRGSGNKRELFSGLTHSFRRRRTRLVDNINYGSTSGINLSDIGNISDGSDGDIEEENLNDDLAGLTLDNYVK